MAASILNQGQTDIRNAVKAVVSHVGVATDTIAFSATQTAIDPANGGAPNLLIKAATKVDVDFQTEDYTITITGATEFTNKVIETISICKGAARTDALTRSRRGAGLGIGVMDGDVFTIGVRGKHEDNS